MDAMALLLTLPRIPDRFIDPADLILSAVTKQAGERRRIDFVADQYPSVSTKNIEREKRGRTGQLAVQITSPQQLCRRQCLTWFEQDQPPCRCVGDRPALCREDRHEQSCSKISVVAQGSIFASIVFELCSSQEEADT